MEPRVLDQVFVVFGVVRHHDGRRAFETVDEQRGHFIRRKTRRAPDHRESPLSQPIGRRGQQSVRHLLLVHAFEEPEEADGLLVILHVIPIVDGDDTSDRLISTQGDERLDLGMLVERVFPPIEHHLHVAEERSDPVRVTLVDAVRQVEKPAELLLAVRRNDLYVRGHLHATSIPCPRTPYFLPTRSSCSSTKSSCSSVCVAM